MCRLYCRRVAVIFLCVVGTAGLSAAAGTSNPNDSGKDDSPAGRMSTYDSRYYVIHTDLDSDSVKEASARMTAMAEEYHARTQGFAGAIRSKLPFFLFKRPQDYYAAGGIKGSAGVFDGKRLMAIAAYGDETTWHVVQHEGFHQFAFMVIGGSRPVWVDEGLAEYFGGGIWTGDGFVTGVIPPGREKAVQALILSKKMLPLMDMIKMSHENWNGALSMRNYDQAWSMVQFLVHADGGKYSKAFGAFISSMSKGQKWDAAFTDQFGHDVDTFQKRYSDWWLALPANPSDDLYALATAQTLNSFLARAVAAGQKFDDAQQFLDAAAKADGLKTNPRQWLPPSLLKRAMEDAPRRTGWSLETSKATGMLPRLMLRLPDGTKYVGSYAVSAGMAENVKVTVESPKPATRSATSATASSAGSPATRPTSRPVSG